MIRKLFFLLVILVFAITFGTKAQQEAQFTQFMYNHIVL